MLSLTRLCPPSVSLLTPTRTAKAFLGYSIIHSSKNAPCFASNSFLHRPQSLFQSLTMTKKRSLATQENSGAAKRTKTVEEMATVVENTSKVERNGGQEIDIVTFNVNGIRAAVKKGLLSFVEEANADIICFNEVKATLGDVTEVVDGLKELDYQHYCWNASETKKGYAGTAVFSKIEPISVVRGLGADAHDGEGRVITVEYEKYYLVVTYVPNAGQKLKRLEYRTEEWDVALLAHLMELEKRKPIIWTGDLNVAHKEIDIHNPKTNLRSAGFTVEERSSFDQVFQKAGFVDVFRHFYPNEKDRYTYWSYRFNARNRNMGWRLDYFIASPLLFPSCVPNSATSAASSASTSSSSVMPSLPSIQSTAILSEMNQDNKRISDHAPIHLRLTV